MADKPTVEDLRRLAREQLRKEYEDMREALVTLWQSGKSIEQVRNEQRHKSLSG